MKSKIKTSTQFIASSCELDMPSYYHTLLLHSSSAVYISLYWRRLPHQILTLISRALHTETPEYLSGLLHPCSSVRPLSSNVLNLLSARLSLEVIKHAKSVTPELFLHLYCLLIQAVEDSQMFVFSFLFNPYFWLCCFPLRVMLCSETVDCSVSVCVYKADELNDNFDCFYLWEAANWPLLLCL